LALAISDAALPAVTPSAGDGIVVTMTRRWLGEPSVDLTAVLDAAGIDPAAWHDRVVPMLRLKWAAADAGLTPPGDVAASGPQEPARRRFGLEGHPPPQPDAGIASLAAL
jgi:hypothetical protein